MKTITEDIALLMNEKSDSPEPHDLSNQPTGSRFQ